MRGTDIIPAMLLLTDQERQEAETNFKQGLACAARKDFEGAVRCYAAAAKLGHAGAQNNLSNLYRKGLGVAQNARTAFLLCLEAARHGNLVAQRNVGALYLRGIGTASDFEAAVAWLEAAAERGSAEACATLAGCYQSGAHQDGEKEAFWRRRAAELGDGTAGQRPEPPRRGPAMPPMDPARARASQHREFYTEPWSLPGAAALDGRLYYLCQDALCVSGLDGGGARVLAQGEELWGRSLAVSDAGVFLYAHQFADGRDVLRICQLDLDGRRIGEHLLDADDFTGAGLYIVNDNLYYCVSKNGKNLLRVYNASSRTGRTLYGRADEIRRLCANERFAAFQAVFENGDLREEGWMLYDLAAGRISCLDSSLSPEQVLDCPERFDEDSPAYVASVSRRKIVFLDMAREILWTERGGREADGGMICWEPRPLTGGWDRLVPDAPVWRLERERWFSIGRGQIYFDGDRLFAAPDYYHFYGCDRGGDVFHWDMSHGHGSCNRFLVAGELLLLDIDACGEMVYRAEPRPSEPVGRSWRGELPPRPETSGGAAPSGASPGDLEAEKALTATNLNYGILTMGAPFHIGFGVPVTVVFGSSRYAGKTHSTSKGRVDGVKRLFTDHSLAQGDVVRARYAAAEGVIYLSLA